MTYKAIILIIGLLSFPTQKASALYINATPKKQTISNVIEYVSWNVGWGGGQSPYSLYFRGDVGQSYRVLISGTNNTSRSWSYKYDLGAAASSTWNPRFRVIGSYGSGRSDS